MTFRSSLAAVAAGLTLLLAGATMSPPEAEAARCESFVYRVNFGPIRIYTLRTNNLRCPTARRLIRSGTPPASTYNWIGSGYRCGSGYSGTGYYCRKGSRSLRWRWKLAD